MVSTQRVQVSQRRSSVTLILQYNGRKTMSRVPVHEIRLGLIKASIWRNQTKSGERHSVTVARLYKNGDTWKESSYFGRDDLLLVAKVADLAHSWITQPPLVRENRDTEMGP